MQYGNMASQVQSRGRGEDSVLVHMTPGEVGGLQALAMRHGGSLSINPDTGLPEAGFLSKILPTVLGAGLAATGIGAPLAALAVGAGTGLITGDLNKGLMAGLQAFGGAGLGGALGLGAAGAGAGAGAGAAGAALPAAGAAPATAINATTAGMTEAANLGAQAAGTAAGNMGANMTGAITNLAPSAMSPATTAGLPSAFGNMGTNMAGAVQNFAPQTANVGANMAGDITNMATQSPSGAALAAQQAAAPVAPPKPMGFFDRFKDATAIKGVPGSMTTGAAGLGLYAGLSGAMSGKSKKSDKDKSDYGYTGPYSVKEGSREVDWPTTGPAFDSNFQAPPSGVGDTSEHNFFPNRIQYQDSRGAAWTPGQKTTPGGKDPYSSEEVKKKKKFLGIFADGGLVGQQPMQQMPLAGNAQSMATQVPTVAQQYQALPSPSTSPPKGLPGLARGGSVALQDGSFVVDARTVSELGNGSSGAGQEVLAGLGGVPIQGPGDGVSDSIHASIGGTIPARVARDEVHFTPDAVAKLGGGDHKKGTAKLYKLMDQAHKARKKAGRGSDTGLRRGLG